MKAFIQTKEQRKDGTIDCYLTQEVPVKVTQRPWKGRTVSGYGRALPTEYMVRYNGQWRRVKAICFSTCATLYIGKAYSQLLTVSIERI